MILADKIITLRKKAGWSQEELAVQLGVTRQSVSKWEGAQSVPDLDKVVQMSRIFGVSTDYLLKDELEEEEFVESAADEAPLRRVTMEQAAQYLALRRACAPKIALAVVLCIVSPVVLIFLTAMADTGWGGISENLAAGLGVSVLLVLVAAAVGIFLSCGAKTKEFDFLEKEPFETEYGVSGMVRERRKAYEPTALRCTILGAVHPRRCAADARARSCVLQCWRAAHTHRADRRLRCGGGGCAAGFCRVRCGGARLERDIHRGDGPAFGGGRLHAQKEGAQRRNEHAYTYLLAERDGNLPLLHVRSHGQRAAAQQLVYLGDRRRFVRGGDGDRVARAAS